MRLLLDESLLMFSFENHENARSWLYDLAQFMGISSRNRVEVHE